MDYQNVKLEKKNNILFVTLNRPKSLNALNSKTLAEIEAAVHEIYNDDKIYGAIFTGAGEKAFVAGADISEFNDKKDSEGLSLAQKGQNVFQLIENCPKPVIAAVNGFALGGGCELAMACHIRLASGNAKFGQPEVNLGLIPGYGGTQRLVQYIGKGKALELMMTADMIGAEEAKILGLVNHVYTLEELLPKAEEMMLKILSKSPVAIERVIKAVNAFYDKNTEGYSKEAELFSECFSSNEKKEGVVAFLEKRPANFR